jgi:hypothetical protein
MILDPFILLYSVVSFSLSFWQTLQGAQSRIRPVLVFVWDEAGWNIKNVGSGPAIDIVASQSKNITDWIKPVRLPPLSAGSTYHLRWLGKCDIRALAATYTDFENHEYTTKTWNDKQKFSKGRALKQRDSNTIKPWWASPPPKSCLDV